MSDQHAVDLMALVRELSELEFRRGVLHARIEWHMRLHELAGTTQQEPAAPLALVKPAAPIPKRPAFLRGQLERAVLAYLTESPERTAQQITQGLGHRSADCVRQSLKRLTEKGVLRRTLGGSYALAESHPGSGLVAAQG